MKNELLATLKAGDVIVVSRDTDALCNFGVPTAWAGTQKIIKAVEMGNNRIIVTDGGLALEPRHFELLSTGTAARQPKFGKADVETLRKAGGNTAITAETTTRLHAARKLLETAAVPAKFNESMKQVDEQIRQAKLLHSSLAK